MAEPVDAHIPGDDPRDADIQTQVDDLRVALQEWRRTREYSQSTEERLAHITLQCARMIESWQQMERRRTNIAAIDGRRGEWGAADSRFQHPAGERLRALERAIEFEWAALSEGRSEKSAPANDAATLAESRAAAANLTIRGFASVESRLTALEHDLQNRMAQLSRELQSVVAELRTARPQAAPAAAPAAFPLESVMRIHEELRGAEGESGPGPESLKAGATRALPQPSETALALVARVESLERAVENAADTAVQSRSGWRPLYVLLGLVVAVAAVALIAIWMQRRVDAKLSEAAVKVAAAERERDQQTAAAREEAARQVADARQSAERAQIVSNVLAAPDLVRYWLVGTGGNARAYAQVLYSRSRGMVFSASRLEPAGAGRTYQLWILTKGGAVSAGLITPDSGGRVTLSTDVPVALPGRLAGAIVTVENEGGGTAPSGERALLRVE